ncbi:MAG: glycosyltransferase [Carnobacterium sp.]|uniref:glycosyltransferase family 2 protein n=1 Tax=Carnobacterium sp. TaxID=48221 RepID=UPI00331454F6
MNKITVLTPTYNREKYLMRMYESMLHQTKVSFQWLIVDDGSTDGTEQTMKEIIENHPDNFQIDYVKKQNGGKHSALNFSHSYIKGDYVMVLDSDDYLKNDAIEIICQKISLLKKDDHIGWLAFLKGNEDGTTIDTYYERDGEITNYAAYMNAGRKGECCDVYLTSAFVSYPYPEYSDEKFISESYLNICATVYGEYQMITYNEVIQVVEYMNDGLTFEGRVLQIRNPKGHAELWRQVSGKMFNSKQILKGAWLYIAYSFFDERSIDEILKKSFNKKVVLLNLPFGYAIYVIWKKKYVQKKLAG